MSVLKRAGLFAAVTYCLLITGMLVGAEPPSRLDVRTKIVTLRHVSADTAVRLLHWDDINDLPAGIIDVTQDEKRHALRLEGTPEGITAAVQAIGFVDVAPHRARLTAEFVLLRRSAPIAAGRKTPTARAILDTSFRRIAVVPISVDNNAEAALRIKGGLETGVRLSPRINDDGTVTLRGNVDLGALLSSLHLDAAAADAIGTVELVRTAPSGRVVVVGSFRVRPSGVAGADPLYLYLLITPRA